MKSLKQSRTDRLLRKKLREQKAALTEKNLTKNQKIERDNKFLRKVAKQCEVEGLKRCLHGVPFSGYECFTCNADKIADRLREEWSPRTTYKVSVCINDEGQSMVPLEIKARGLTKKIKEMQDNGFWYVRSNCPIYMTPGKIKVVVVEGAEGMAQNPSHNDPPTTPGPKASGKTRSAQK